MKKLLKTLGSGTTFSVIKNIGDFYHWHIDFMPVLARVAGFEWGTGFYINPISPEESVQALKTI